MRRFANTSRCPRSLRPKTATAWKPAMVKEMKVVDGSIQLHMDVAVGGVDDGGVIEGFAVAGEDRKLHPATAKHLVTGKDNRGKEQKDNKVVLLTSSMVPSSCRIARLVRGLPLNVFVLTNV